MLIGKRVRKGFVFEITEKWVVVNFKEPNLGKRRKESNHDAIAAPDGKIAAPDRGVLDWLRARFQNIDEINNIRGTTSEIKQVRYSRKSSVLVV